jgi:hypothetical protein
VRVFLFTPASYKKKLRINWKRNRKQTTTVISNEDPYSTVAHLHIDSTELSPKPTFSTRHSDLQARIAGLVSRPPLLVETEEIRKAVEDAYNRCSPDAVGESVDESEEGGDEGWTEASSTELEGWITFAEVTAYEVERDVDNELELEGEVRRCFAQLEGEFSLFLQVEA